jgi:methionyl-tRNA synthetase
MTARYITTTLPYVNAVPHIGFAVEILQADVLARAWRIRGEEVFFNTGTDEHGQKIFEGAKSAGEDVTDYVERNAEEVRNLKEVLNLSTDAFIRTTDENHIKAAQELWKICDAKGDIEKKKYKGLYCVGCEKYLTERDLENGKCPLHPDEKPKVVEEENYFFKLSNYKKQLKDYLSDENVIIPEHRRQEALELVRGAEDFSISREKAQLSWGVPVPRDDDQVMYVWFDALTNYISTLDWPEDKDGNFKKFWEEGETLQVAGKDQVRFQSIMWQAMLMSAGISTTNKIFYHGFITSGGQKMSKSIGNVISPLDLVEKYGTDATRYLLLRHVHPFEDTDVTWERLDEWYEANLVNGLGNLVARVMQLAETHFDEPKEVKSQEEINKESERDIYPKISEFRFDYALDHIFVDHIGSIDQKITDTEPFKVIKEDQEKGKKLIAELVSDLFTVAGLLEPFLPETSEIIKSAIKENKKPKNLFPRL